MSAYIKGKNLHTYYVKKPVSMPGPPVHCVCVYVCMIDTDSYTYRCVFFKFLRGIKKSS